MPSYSKQVSVPGKSAQDIYRKVGAELRGFLEKTPIGKYELRQDDAKKSFSIDSGMFKAMLHCEDGKIRLEGSLSLLASPFKGKLDEGIERWVAKTFPA